MTDGQLVGWYSEFRKALHESEFTGRYMKYHWVELPDRLHVVWLVYSQLVADFANELANSINDLTNYVHRLRAWDKVVAGLSDEEKMSVVHEFIGPFATVSLTLPNVIKSRLIFAAGHLCHQANQSRDLVWTDEFPSDDDVYLHTIGPHCSRWRRYRRLQEAIEAIAGADYQKQSDRFRNLYNHRFSPRFLVGMTQLAVRKVEPNGRVVYGVGGRDPFTLAEVASILQIERDRSYVAFEAFQALVNEQLVKIKTHNTAALAEQDACP